MADTRQYDRQVGTRAGEQAVIDEGLRSYMLGIYNYMAIGVAVTGGVAMAMANWVAANPAIGQTLYQSPLRWVIMLAPLAFVMVLSFGINKLSVTAAQAIFWTFAAVMGVSISWIFLVYTGGSIAQTFFITAASFGALSLWGYTTKRDISGWGSFLFMGVIGLILASIVNIFLQSSALMFAVNVLGVLIFAGLTAYDTQRLKHTYDMVAHDATMMAKSSIMGALSLYLNFVNMFMFLLSFLGNRE